MRLFSQTPEYLIFSGRRPLMATRDNVGAERVRSMECWVESVLGARLTPETRTRICGIVDAMVDLDSDPEVIPAPSAPLRCGWCGSSVLVATREEGLVCRACGTVAEEGRSEVTFTEMESHGGGSLASEINHTRQREVDVVMAHLRRTRSHYPDLCERIFCDARADVFRFVCSRSACMRNPYARVVAAGALVTAQIRVYEQEMQRVDHGVVRRRRFDGTDVPLEQPPTMDLGVLWG